MFLGRFPQTGRAALAYIFPRTWPAAPTRGGGRLRVFRGTSPGAVPASCQLLVVGICVSGWDKLGCGNNTHGPGALFLSMDYTDAHK